MSPLHCFIIMNSAFLVSCAARKIPSKDFTVRTAPAHAGPAEIIPPVVDEPRSFKHVETPPGPRVNIFNCGIYQVTRMTGIRRTSPGTTTGFTSGILETMFVSPTHIIPARTGIHFGYRVAVSGISFQEVVPITVRVLHPPTTHPGTGQTTTKEEWTFPMMFQIPGVAVWGFDEDWEAVPGKWTVQVLHQGKLLAEKVFTVVKP